MDELTKGPGKFSLDHLITLIFVMYLKNDDGKANELICYAVGEWPNSRTAQYLNRRMRRNANMLLLDNIPDIYPKSIASFETSLANSQKIPNHSQPRPIRLLCLVFDVSYAILAAGWARCKIKYPRVAALISR